MALKSPQDVARDHMANNTRTSNPEVAYHMTQMGAVNPLSSGVSEVPAALPVTVSSGGGNPWVLVLFVLLLVACIPVVGWLNQGGKERQQQEMATKAGQSILRGFVYHNIPTDVSTPKAYTDLKRYLQADPANLVAIGTFETAVAEQRYTADGYAKDCALYRAALRLVSDTGILHTWRKHPEAGDFASGVETSVNAGADCPR